MSSILALSLSAASWLPMVAAMPEWCPLGHEFRLLAAAFAGANEICCHRLLYLLLQCNDPAFRLLGYGGLELDSQSIGALGFLASRPMTVEE
jgi:hypothetical protein